MAITAFVGPIKECIYVGDPPSQFSMNVPLMLANGVAGTVTTYGPTDEQFTFPTTAIPIDVYQQIYDRIVELADTLGFDEPAKSDVHGYLPTNFAVLLPGLPL